MEGVKEMSEEYEILNEKEVRWGLLSEEEQEAIKGAEEARTLSSDGDFIEWVCADLILYRDGMIYQGRNKKPKAKRLLTVKETWGKTLIHPDRSMFIVDSSYVDENGAFKVHMGSGVFLSFENLHKEGWRLADETLEYENATSLEVEA